MFDLARVPLNIYVGSVNEVAQQMYASGPKPGIYFASAELLLQPEQIREPFIELLNSSVNSWGGLPRGVLKSALGYTASSADNYVAAERDYLLGIGINSFHFREDRIIFWGNFFIDLAGDVSQVYGSGPKPYRYFSQRFIDLLEYFNADLGDLDDKTSSQT